MLRTVNDEPGAPYSSLECDCGHASNLHRLQSDGCLGVDLDDHPCSCTEFRLAEDVPVSERVKFIQEQLALARRILGRVPDRELLPEEQFAVSRLGQALAELTDAVRLLLIG